MEYLDDMFSQFSEAFLGEMAGDGDIPFREKLNTTILNYSTLSLKEIDHYLEILYKNSSKISDLEYQNVIVWCGAYVGEVIRKNAIAEYHWVHYNEYAKSKDTNFKKLIPLALSTHALLVAVDIGYMTMPMNKVARWIQEGKSNNIEYYASIDIAKKKTV